uniref:Uncharacterized protein n=1 Tax=Oryzias latipes TaxID=8090 RepID=A0A3P9HII9_ORYLA
MYFSDVALMPLIGCFTSTVVLICLVQVQPGLCDVGSNPEENQMLIQEQQQLLEKLKETKNLESGFKSQVQSESGFKENPRSRSEDRSNLQVRIWFGLTFP